MILHTFSSLFESSAALTPEQVAFLDEHVIGTWKINPSTGLVDVRGNVGPFLFAEDLTHIPVRFGNVSGDFDCSGNQLISLENSPQKVEGNFDCSANQLISLENSPSEVGGDFLCSSNRLKSLKGIPQKIGSHFDCRSNLLISLQNSPSEVGGDFYCSLNRLDSLEYSPQKVGGTFYCSHNQLTSLVGAPQKVVDYFDCSANPLTNLEGAPSEVGGDFYCKGIKFTSLEGAPKKIGGEFSSSYFVIPKGKWGFEGWMKVLVTGDEKARSLIFTLLSPSAINKEMEKDPEQMLMRLKGVWNSPGFASTRKEIVIPSKYREEMNTLGDLNDLGF